MSLKEFRNISGPRVDLVEIAPEYFEKVIKWRNDPEIARFFFSKSKITLEGQRQWYQRYKQNETDITLIIATKSGGTVGMAALYDIDRQEQRAEFGRMLIGESEFIGMGLGQEVCRLVMNYAFEVLNLHQIYLYVYDWNLDAKRLYNQLGFTTTGLPIKQEGRSDSIRKMTLTPADCKYAPFGKT